MGNKKTSDVIKKDKYTEHELTLITSPEVDKIYSVKGLDSVVPDMATPLNERYRYSNDVDSSIPRGAGDNLGIDYFSVKNHTLPDAIGMSSSRRILARRDGTGVVYYSFHVRKMVIALYRNFPTNGWVTLDIPFNAAYHDAITGVHDLAMTFEYMYDGYPEITLTINDLPPIVRPALRGYRHSKMIAGDIYGKTMEKVVINSPSQGNILDTSEVITEGAYLYSAVYAKDKFVKISPQEPVYDAYTQAELDALASPVSGRTYKLVSAGTDEYIKTVLWNGSEYVDVATDNPEYENIKASGFTYLGSDIGIKIFDFATLTSATPGGDMTYNLPDGMIFSQIIAVLAMVNGQTNYHPVGMNSHSDPEEEIGMHISWGKIHFRNGNSATAEILNRPLRGTILYRE